MQYHVLSYVVVPNDQPALNRVDKAPRSLGAFYCPVGQGVVDPGLELGARIRSLYNNDLCQNVHPTRLRGGGIGRRSWDVHAPH